MIRILVDGNNLLEALKLGANADLVKAEQFLQGLETAAARSDWEVTAVFDGRERFLPRESGPLIVMYAKPQQAADSVIERLVYQSPDRGCVIVVTLDRAEANLVLGLGARVWTPQRLLEELGAQ